MSVHGEYGRALEALLHGLRALDHPKAEAWQHAARSARAGEQPSLSDAAKHARQLIRAIRGDTDAAPVEGLADPLERLEAHCQAILG